jgi:hypothetical protein
MAIIIDPDNLVLTTDIVVDTSTKTIEIKTTGAVTNAGSTGGVSGQTLYSWLKEQWKSSSTFIKYPFPMEAITPEQFEFIGGWAPKDDTTRNLIRTAGWAEKNSSGTVLRKYAGVVSLGTLGGSDQPYYRWNTSAKANFAFTGPVNQAIQIYGDAANGNFDYTGGASTLTLYVREQGKTYATSNNTAIGAATLSYITYRFPLSNGTDLKISASDATIAASAPYTNISIEYFTTDQARNIDGTSAPFRIIITDSGTSATTQQIYEKMQWSLRQNTDIDTGAGTVTGATADALVSFLGDTLVGATSVAIDGLNSNYLNSVSLFDKNGVNRLYPFVAAGTINFGANAGSGDFKYWLFYATNPTGDFGTSTAVVVNDASGTPIQGTYSGSPVGFSFAYDTNTQGGRTAGTTPAVKALGIGLTGGQYTLVDTTITRAQGQSILLAPAQERNYNNPV